MARPTKYNPNILKKTLSYIERAVIAAKAKNYEDFPSIEGLAMDLSVDTDTVVEWEKIHPQFSVAIKKLKSIQRQYLMFGGLSEATNTAMSIFLLKANHGFKETDKQEVDQTIKIISETQE